MFVDSDKTFPNRSRTPQDHAFSGTPREVHAQNDHSHFTPKSDSSGAAATRRSVGPCAPEMTQRLPPLLELRPVASGPSPKAHESTQRPDAGGERRRLCKSGSRPAAPVSQPEAFGWYPKLPPTDLRSTSPQSPWQHRPAYGQDDITWANMWQHGYCDGCEVVFQAPWCEICCPSGIALLAFCSFAGSLIFSLLPVEKEHVRKLCIARWLRGWICPKTMCFTGFSGLRREASGLNLCENCVLQCLHGCAETRLD